MHAVTRQAYFCRANTRDRKKTPYAQIKNALIATAVL